MKSNLNNVILVMVLMWLAIEVEALHLQTAALHVDNLQQSNLNYYFSTMSPSSFYANINQFRSANPSAQSCPPGFPYANYTNKNLSCFACDPLTNNSNLKTGKVLFNVLTRQCQQCTINKTEICNKILNGTFVAPTTTQTNTATPLTTSTATQGSTAQPTTTTTTTTTTANTPTSPSSPTASPTITQNNTSTSSSTPTNTTKTQPQSTATQPTTTTTQPAATTTQPQSTNTQPSTATSTTSTTTTTTPTQTSTNTTPKNTNTISTTNTTNITSTNNTQNTTSTSTTPAPVNTNGCAASRPFLNKTTGLCDPCPQGTEFINSKQTCQPALFATSSTAPNLILSNQSQLVDLNQQKQKKNPQQVLQYCPADKPYASKNICVKCEKGQYFYVATSACVTGCPQGTYYDSNVLACSPALYYSNVNAPWLMSQQGNYQTWKAKIENIARSSPRMIVCPSNKPYEVNGTCISCPTDTFFNIDLNKCLPCGKNRYYEPNQRKCLGIVNYRHSMKTFASSIV